LVSCGILGCVVIDVARTWPNSSIVAWRDVSLQASGRSMQSGPRQVVREELEILSIRGICRGWTSAIFAAPKPAPTVRVAIGKREVGAKVVLFAGQRGP